MRPASDDKDNNKHKAKITMKIMKTLGLLAVMVVALVAASCSGSDSAAAVASKISKGETLDQADYTEMIEYCGRYAEQAQTLQDKINTLAPTSEEAGKLTDEIAALSGKYPYASQFFDKISNCTEAEVGAENVARINKLGMLTWFSAPEWADSTDNSNVAGSIVDMPSTDTTGVIAGGDGEAVE